MTGSSKGNVPTLAGWAVTILVGAGVFVLLRNSVGYHVLSSSGFGIAAALFMLLLLTGSADAEDTDTDPRVRKIVPQYEPIRPPVPPAAPEAVSPVRVTKVALAPEPAAEAVTAPEPQSAGQTGAVGPLRLAGPRGGKADDLKVLEGVGPALEKLLNGLGIHHFDQIAGWSEADVAAVDAEMKNFKGRIALDRWVAQAKIIVTEGLEAFRERVKSNNY